MECFVCASSQHPLYKMCRCSTVVHAECFHNLLRVPSHSTHCAICRTKYDISTTYRTVILPREQWHILLVACISLPLSAVAFVTAYACAASYNIPDGGGVLTYMFFCIAVVLGGCFSWLFLRSCAQYVRSARSLCCVQVKHVPVRRCVKLPKPTIPNLIEVSCGDSQENLFPCASCPGRSPTGENVNAQQALNVCQC